VSQFPGGQRQTRDGWEPDERVKRRDRDRRRAWEEDRREKKARVAACGTLTWALIPCHEYATCIIWGPKATIYSTGTGANMQETP
jgi:hypothetical protein